MPDFDILCAGFPCQPFSIAGNQTGFQDKTRGNLFYKILEIIDRKQPLGELGEVIKNENGSESDTSDTSILSKINFVAYDIAPKPIIPIKPIYPEQAKKNGIEGTIFVQYFIDKTGKVTEAWVIKGIPNSGLDESALSAVRNSSWEPALQGEMKVGIWQTVPVKFEL